MDRRGRGSGYTKWQGCEAHFPGTTAAHPYSPRSLPPHRFTSPQTQSPMTPERHSLMAQNEIGAALRRMPERVRPSTK